MGTAYYTDSGTSILQATVDIMVGQTLVSFFSHLNSTCIMGSSEFYNAGDSCYYGCCLGITPSTFQTLRIGPDGYTESNSKRFLPGTRLQLIGMA